MRDSDNADRPFYRHIPEIYKNDELLCDIVSVFENSFLELENKVDCLPSILYKAENTPEQLLNFVGALVGLNNEDNFFTAEQMRLLIPYSFGFNLKKGTRAVLLDVLNIYIESICGYKTNIGIFEYAEVHGKALPQCFAELIDAVKSPEDFAVVLTHIPTLPAYEKNRLLSLTKKYCPANTVPHLIYLDGVTLGEGCYLGYSSVLI